jgi:murein L,D-transpeptidase YcbB/YkuD
MSLADYDRMHRSHAWRVIAITTVCLGLIAAGGCSRNDTKALAPVLQKIVAGRRPASVSSDTWGHVRKFYEQRSGMVAWVTKRNARAAAAATQLLDSAPEYGLPADAYRGLDLASALDAIDKAKTKETDARRLTKLAEFDVRLTSALMTFAHDVALGRTTPVHIEPRWKMQRTAPDFATTLNAAIGGDLTKWIHALEPSHPQYVSLRQALARMRSGAAAADRSTEERIRQISLNLDRWRWMPDDLGDRHILVNLPAYQLFVYENGATPLTMRVIVGEADNTHETPIFSAHMTTVTFSPYWNIPDTIAEGEIAPAVARDPNYLARQNIDILRVTKSGATPVDPSKIDWENPDELKELAFRQRPGTANALGTVKFVLDDPYAIYLHDTPSDHLFARARRALSHGCVRLDQPEALAKYVLRDQPAWDDGRIRAAMQGGEEEPVKLTAPIPVHLVYFTTWVDAGGHVQFFPDVYGYDRRQAVR